MIFKDNLKEILHAENFKLFKPTNLFVAAKHKYSLQKKITYWNNFTLFLK